MLKYNLLKEKKEVNDYVTLTDNTTISVTNTLPTYISQPLSSLFRMKGPIGIVGPRGDKGVDGISPLPHVNGIKEQKNN